MVIRRPGVCRSSRCADRSVGFSRTNSREECATRATRTAAAHGTRAASRRTRSSRCGRSDSAARTRRAPSKRFRLQDRGRPAVPPVVANSDAKNRDADAGDDLRLEAAHLPPQHPGALDVLLGACSVSMPGVARGTRLVMPYPHSGSRSSSSARIGFGHQPRFVQQLPEPVRMPREVMADRRRPHARIDADKQHARRRPDAVAKHRCRIEPS